MKAGWPTDMVIGRHAGSLAARHMTMLLEHDSVLVAVKMNEGLATAFLPLVRTCGDFNTAAHRTSARLGSGCVGDGPG